MLNGLRAIFFNKIISSVDTFRMVNMKDYNIAALLIFIKNQKYFTLLSAVQLFDQ